MKSMYELEVESFDVTAFKAEHPDLAVSLERFVSAVELAQQTDGKGIHPMLAVSAVRQLRDKIEAKYRSQLRAARGEP